MKQTIFLFLLIFSSILLFSQKSPTAYYWIKLKDKNTDGYSVSNPQQFLSQKSIDRRTKQGLSVDSSDLPITQSYIDGLSPYITTLVHRLKWFNMVVVLIDDTTGTNVNTISHLPFVDSISQIQNFPYKSLQHKNKFEDVIQADQRIVYPDIHGSAYHQLNMMNADLLYQLGFRGDGITVAIMDNGLRPSQVRIDTTYYQILFDTISYFDSVRPRILGTWDFVHNQQSVYTDGGHGLTTFSCFAANIPYKYVGAAPDASFYLFQSEDNDAEWVMEEYNWAAAAEMADSAGAQLFSTSLGYTTFNYDIGDNTYADLSGNKTVITQAGNTAFSKGILVLNSAGNDGDTITGQYNTWHYIAAPADGDSILAVGAVDSARNRGYFSSWGPNSAGRVKPDICAQGAGAAIVNTGGYTSYSNGTSYSCPIMAGCAASLWSAFPDRSAKEIKEAIVISADRFWTPDSAYGYGIPNFYNAYLLLKTNYNGNILHLNDQSAVYPNPFSTELNISFYNVIAGNHTIQIFDLLGQEILSQQVYIRDKTFDIVPLNNVNSLKAGEYVLRLDGNKKYSHKIIKINP